MADLQERIKNNKEYFRSMELIENTYIVKVKFPKRWGTFNSDNTDNATIKVAKSDDEVDTWYYYASIDNSSFDEIFNLIEDTVTMNKNAFAKVELLKQRVEELKELFEHESLDRLIKLEFKLPKEKKKTVKKSVSDKPSTAEEITVPQPQENAATEPKNEE